MQWGGVNRIPVSGLGTKTVSEAYSDWVESPFKPDIKYVWEAEPHEVLVVALGNSWFTSCKSNFVLERDKSRSRSIVLQRDGTAFRCDIEHAPAVVGGSAYGMGSQGGSSPSAPTASSGISSSSVRVPRERGSGRRRRHAASSTSRTGRWRSRAAASSG
jgi:hypothetical protein